MTYSQLRLRPAPTTPVKTIQKPRAVMLSKNGETLTFSSMNKAGEHLRTHNINIANAADKGIACKGWEVKYV